MSCNQSTDMNPEAVLLRNVTLLSEPKEFKPTVMPRGSGPFPSVERLREIMTLIRDTIFPDFFDKYHSCRPIRSHYIGVCVDRIYGLLQQEIGYGLHYDRCHPADDVEDPMTLTLHFIDMLPQIKHMLYTDVEAIYNNDPAVDNIGEVILCYPGVKAMIHYRVAHAMTILGIPVLPRILTEMAHSNTGIDIHPGAEIGEYFSIDHGTGVVIGETCVIGNNVTLYQGVTLGAKNFSLDSHGHPINIPRHPIIEDNVTIYSNATILGRITVGHDSIIGGNVWLTHDVPAGSKILQGQNIQSSSK